MKKLEKIYVFALAGLAAVVGAVFMISSYAGLPIWVALIGMVMVSAGCLVLLADMNRPEGGFPGFKTTALMIFLFLPAMPVVLPIALILLVVSFVRHKLLQR
ncbi:MAG: hypothetical protein ACI83N_000073 [Hydrogenophaga sp.]|jgi:hypothetical protein